LLSGHQQRAGGITHLAIRLPVLSQVKAFLRQCNVGPAVRLFLFLYAATGTCAAAPPESSESSAMALYGTHCASCHGDNLAGGQFGPSLNSDKFRSRWYEKGARALHVFIAQSMPPSKPGSLSSDSYTEISSLIARTNKIDPSPAPAESDMQHPPVPADATPADAGGVGAVQENFDAWANEVLATHKAQLAALTTVTENMLHQPSPDDWLSVRRSDDASGFSPLRQIDRRNVTDLVPAWSLALPVGTNAITPLVHDGVIFLNSSGTVLAIDASTGDILWSYTRRATVSPMGAPVSQPRGMAMFEDRLFVPTVDDHMLALDIRSGNLIWDHLITGARKTLRITAAPIVVHGKIIQGMSGCAGAGEPGGCFIVALNALTGDEVWRFNTIARAGTRDGDTWNGAPTEQRFGASVWASGSYDPINNLVYFGTGQTYHIQTLMLPNPKRRHANSGLYTDTTLALDPDSGRLVWHYQHLAREVWDLDWAFERIVTDLTIEGRSRHVVMTMGKLGIVDVLDARSGQFLFSVDMGIQTLVVAIDPKTGWKTTDPSLEPDPNKPKTVCPFPSGVRAWQATSYDAAAGLLYVPGTDSCMDLTYTLGQDFDISYAIKPRPGSDGMFGKIAAINLKTRKVEWLQSHRATEASSALATAGGLLFEGGRDRYFRATDTNSGHILWQVRLDAVPSASPISFSSKGIQYVAITTGGGNPNDVTNAPLTPEIPTTAPSSTLIAFKLHSSENLHTN
jgi:alcohol dehydrogenase (cytochrome c)